MKNMKDYFYTLSTGVLAEGNASDRCWSKNPKPCNYPPLSFDSAEVECELLRATINYANTFLQFRQSFISHQTLYIVYVLHWQYKRRYKNVQIYIEDPEISSQVCVILICRCVRM